MAKEPVGKAETNSSQDPVTTPDAIDKPENETDRRESSLVLSRILLENRETDIAIQGTVTDEKGEGLPGMSIVVKGTQRGTTSDTEGNRLDVPTEAAILIFSYVGYLAQEVGVGNRTTVDVTLTADNRTLDEIVVVDYGTVRKKDLTGSV